MTAMEKAEIISSYFIWALLMALHSIQKGAWHQRAMATMWFNNLTWPTKPAFDCILQESQESQEASCLWHGRLKADIRGGKDISIACELRLLSRVSMNEGPGSTWKLMPKGSAMPMQWDTRRAAIFLNRKVSQELCDQSSTEKIGSCAASKPRGSWSFPTTHFPTWFGQPWPYQDFQSFGSKDACLLKHLTSSDTSLLTCISNIPGG